MQESRQVGFALAVGENVASTALLTGGLLAVWDDGDGSAEELLGMFQGNANGHGWKLLRDGIDVTRQATQHVAVYGASKVLNSRKTPWSCAAQAAGTFPLVQCGKKARAALHAMQLDEAAHCRLNKLTEEQRVRAWLACALASDHSMILLPGRPEKDLRKALKGKLTAIYHAKSMEETADADRVLVLHEHRLDHVCTPWQLLHAPKSLYVAQKADRGEMLPVRVAARNARGGLALDMDGLVIPVSTDNGEMPAIGTSGWLWVERDNIRATKQIVNTFHLSAVVLENANTVVAQLPNGAKLHCQCDEEITRDERIFVTWDVAKARFLQDECKDERM